MSYLLAQILICLLIAGLIGFIIGWLWSRFGWRKKLVDNDELWESKIDDLVGDHRTDLSAMSSKIHKAEADGKILETNLKSELSDSNGRWESKVHSLMGTQNDNNKELETLTLALAKSKDDAKILEKSLREKLNIANNTWESKVQGLVSQQNDNNVKLDTLKEKEKVFNAELDDSNRNWENRVQGLVSTQGNSDKELSVLKETLKKSKIIEGTLRSELSKSEAETKKLERVRNNERTEANKQLNLLKEEVENADSKFNTNNSDLAKKLQNLEELNKLNKSTQDECVKRNIELNEKLKNVELECNKQLKDSNHKWEDKVRDLTGKNDSSSEVETLRAALVKAEGDVEALKIEVETVKTSISEPVREIGKVDRKHKRRVKGMRKEKKVKRHDHQDEESETTVSNPVTTVSKSTGISHSAKDNLQLIKGIGKVLEKVLNDLGIYRFEQISSWTKEEVIKVDEPISFPGRIEREEWIKQAKQLDAGEQTEFSERVKQGDVPTSKNK